MKSPRQEPMAPLLDGDDEFELFTGRTAGAPPRDLLVTFQKRGLLTFNRAAFEALGEPEAVELLYNRKRHLLGIRAGDPANA